MKPGRGKQKGNAFEREICKKLSHWINPEKELFWRSASSGAKATVDLSGKSNAMSGDIVSVDSEGSWFTDHFSIECKSYKKFSFVDFFLRKGEITKWWRQCVSDAKKSKKTPMMIFKKNRSPVFIALPHSSIKGPIDKQMIINQTAFYLLEDWLIYNHPDSVKQRIEGL